MYQVSTREHGRPIVKNGPCQGLPDFARSRWTNITPRPIGLARAIALADTQPGHAVVTVWQESTKMHDNGKPPILPDGWKPA